MEPSTSEEREERTQAVARRWGREAARYDQHFDHTIGSEAERTAWDRAFQLLDGGRRSLAVLDAGTGTGFLALELAARGHVVTGIDLAPEMLAQAREKALQHDLQAQFEAGDAERPPFRDATFDLIVSRHVLWSLSDRASAVTVWRRLLRPGGRVGVFDGEWGRSDAEPPALATPSDAPTAQAVAALLAQHGYVDVDSDPLEDLSRALHPRARREGRTVPRFSRYLVWGEKLP